MLHQTAELTEFLLSLIKNSPYGIITINLEGAITMANSLAAQHLGFSLEDALDMPVVDVIEDIPDLLQNVKKSLRTGQEGFEIPSVSYKEHFFLFRAVTIVNGMFITSEDITEKVKSEQEMKELNAALIVNNRQLQQYTYITSHNLRAPVANMMALTDLFTESESSEEKDFIVESIRETAHSLNQILVDLNEIVSIKSDVTQTKHIIKLNDEIDGVLKALAHQIKDSKAEITVDFSAMPEILSVKSYISSIFYNLVSNAIKYRSPRRTLKLKITAKKVKKTCILTFKDNGVGIDMKVNGDKV
ncbi:MAG: PAS domain S-box protein, partial [Bacteroidota bacterium]